MNMYLSLFSKHVLHADLLTLFGVHLSGLDLALASGVIFQLRSTQIKEHEAYIAVECHSFIFDAL